MTLKIYGLHGSPPCRAVIITAKILDLPYEYKEVNILKGEHLQQEYLEINPLHTIPAIDDDGFILYDSHAILMYLISKYAKDDSFYPQDVQKQAYVNQRLYFNASTMSRRFSEVMSGLFKAGSVSDEAVANVKAALKQVGILLGDNDWIADTPNYTIADISLLCTIDNCVGIIPGVVDGHEKVAAWLQRGRDTIPEYENLTRPAIKGLRDILGISTDE